jgi:non-heme Fe2+,alpha-ketoglutarate-dependent halogenase
MTKNLSPQQKKRYEDEGILFPIPALKADEVLRFRSELERLERALAGHNQSVPLWQPHIHFRWAYELATHPALLDIVETITGPNILVHTSSIFCKEPHDARSIHWHQDGHYWSLNSPRLVTAWVALTESSAQNGCMRVIPLTHQQRLPHRSVKDEGNMLASGLSLAQRPDETIAVNITLRAGEISLHHLNIIHGSRPNRSAKRRIGVAVRYVPTEVSQKLKHHAVVLARGRDDFHNYELLREPPSNDIEAGIESLVKLDGWIRQMRLGEEREASNL